MSQVPESDLARIRGFCKTRVPAELLEQVRIDFRMRGAAVTIVECRPPWSGDAGGEWTEQPVARLRLDSSGWTLLCFDGNGRAHWYEPGGRGLTVMQALAEVEADPTCIFWG